MKLPAALFAGLMLVGGCASDATLPTTVPDEVEPTALLATLADARARWESAAPADYTVTEACSGCEDRTVAVRSGEVVSLTGADQQTIDELFRQIEDAIHQGAQVEVTYDTNLGYPTTLTIDADRNGVPEIDLAYLDLEAMPIVTTLQELLDARAKWDALGLDDYRYLFRAACSCSEEGTWQVTVVDGRVTEELPLDDAANSSKQISPGSLDAAFDDLEEWFTNSGDLIAEGILEVDVRMDPEFGYPRWFRVVAEGLEAEGPLTDRFEIIVTTELMGPVDVVATIDDDDLGALRAAQTRWQQTGFTDYRFEVQYHCECPREISGPFEITIRNGEFWSAVAPPDEGFGDAGLYDTITIDQVFEVIHRAIIEATDVDVTYDETTGQPLLVIIDPEAVAVDGGLAFSLTPVEIIDPLGFLDLEALAGPQCPVQQSPPDPECEDAPVPGAEVILTRPGSDVPIPLTTDEHGHIFVALEPGTWIVTPQPVDGLLGTAEPIEVVIESNRTTEVVAGYDTGIR